MGAKMNFVLSIVTLVIAIVGCVLAVRLSFFGPAPLSEDKVAAMIEEKTKTYVTEEKVKEIVEGAVTALIPAAPEEGKKE
jgi:16S rRNA A1518/A1519 N6-dimethyltransferase RsmA/KsgA/DIM1 with predicted DNA glycosylase/AP lyase activity